MGVYACVIGCFDVSLFILYAYCRDNPALYITIESRGMAEPLIVCFICRRRVSSCGRFHGGLFPTVSPAEGEYTVSISFF